MARSFRSFMKKFLMNIPMLLNRDKFHLKRSTIEKFLRLFEVHGVEVIPQNTDEVFLDIHCLILPKRLKRIFNKVQPFS